MKNNKLKRILFIGNFLSKAKGTINPSESIAHKLQMAGYSIKYASSYKNTLLRFVDILFSSLCRGYDGIHIDVFSGKALWFALFSTKIARLRKKYVILNLHGGKLPELYPQKKRQIDYMFRESNKIVTPSNFLKVFFTTRGFDVDYLPNAIDLNSFSYRWSPSLLKKRSILWVRAFAEIYRPILAVDILRELLKKYPDASLTMIGPDGGQLQQTLAHIRKHGLIEKVFIRGPVPNRDLAEYFGTHAVFLNTTQYESFGMSVLESIACGLPVVSSSVGELPYLWEDGTDALLIKDDFAEAFALRIGDLFDSPSLAISLSENSQRKVADFKWDSLKTKWASLLELN